MNTIPFATQQEWLALRKQGIGGSDASAVLGVNPYKSQIEVYLDKIGETEPIPDNPFMFWGRKLEPLIREEFQQQTGFDVHEIPALLQSDKFPFMIGSVDGIGTTHQGRPFVLECKTANGKQATVWKDGQVPIHYVLQLAHYLSITGYTLGFFAVLIGGNDFRIIPVERDRDVEAMMVEGEREFWRKVEARELPQIDGSQATADALLQMYPREVPDSSHLLPADTFQSVCQQLIALKQQVKEHETSITQLENLLKNELGEHETGRCGDFQLAWKTVESTRFDTKAFRTVHADLYDSFTKPSSYRRFSIKNTQQEE
jgi:putative phage-type endonuclease